MSQVDPTALSLLWPDMQLADSNSVQPLYGDTVRDLRVDELAQALGPTARSRTVFGRILRQIVSDPAIIRYRQAIFSDLLANPALAAALQSVLPQLDGMTAQQFTFRKRHALYDVVERLGELDLYVTAVHALTQAFAQSPNLQSGGLQRLQAMVQEIVAKPSFATLVTELPELQKTVRQAASVTIGVNLDHNLKPVAATLLTVNGEPFTASSMLNRIFGRIQPTSTGNKLHQAPNFDQATMADLRSALGSSSPQIMTPLFADLADVLEKVSRPVAHALRAYGDVTTATLVNLRDELAFYLDGLALHKRMQQADLPLSIPTIAERAAGSHEIGVFSAENCYNLHLALQDNGKPVVRNDIDCDQTRRVILLTGPNGGGKTTWLQSIGLIYLLAQAGLPVPATAATITPVDNIFTHYQGEEDPAAGTGRFGEEAVRFQKLFTQATNHSLLLLNESLASTSAGESLYLAQDIVLLFAKIGLRAVFATHLHALAAQVDTLNAQLAAPCIVSMVASPIDAGASPNARSYKIVVGPPIGRSYAKELAARYGISATQLTDLLKQRGVFPDSTD